MRKLKISGLINVGLVLGIALLPIAPGQAQGPKSRPDFSGTWVFDPDATDAVSSLERKGTNIFGASFVAHQDARSLTFDITIAQGAPPIQATYALDGSQTKNVSPPQTVGAAPIVVRATAKWLGDKLIIESRSRQPGGRGARGATGPTVVNVVSTRTIWLDQSGRLVIDRDGTPKPVVPSTRSVYKKQ